MRCRVRFDSMNPYTRKGKRRGGCRRMMYESLLGDRPSGGQWRARRRMIIGEMYGLLAA